MLSIYLLQQWQPVESGDSGGALDVRLLQQFAGLDLGSSRLPDTGPILRHLLREHLLFPADPGHDQCYLAG